MAKTVRESLIERRTQYLNELEELFHQTRVEDLAEMSFDSDYHDLVRDYVHLIADSKLISKYTLAVADINSQIQSAKRYARKEKGAPFDEPVGRSTSRTTGNSQTDEAGRPLGHSGHPYA